MQRMIPRFGGVALLIVLYIFYFSWLAVDLFPPETPEGEFLSNALEAAWQLLILFTTANFPDVMLPAYRCPPSRPSAWKTCLPFWSKRLMPVSSTLQPCQHNSTLEPCSNSRIACLFFMAFVVIGVFFLSNYLLAVVYEAYSQTEKEHQARALSRRKESLNLAFRQLPIHCLAFHRRCTELVRS